MHSIVHYIDNLKSIYIYMYLSEAVYEAVYLSAESG